MAAISSLIINYDQSAPIFSPLANTSMQEQITPEPPQAALISEDLLAEINAIQAAMQSQTDFDFSTLEPTSAGNTQDSFNDKSLSSPILLEDPGLIINYRGEAASTPSINQETVNSISTENLQFDEDSTLTTINSNPISQIQASVSEDFITQTSGKFESSLTMPAQEIDTPLGTFTSDGTGNWQYSLNNQLAEVQALSSGDSINDLIELTSNTGQTIQIAIEINGTNDQAIITGPKYGEIQATPIENLGNIHPSISGKLNVSDIDTGEARFETNFDIQGSFGVAQINALGEWTYTLNNSADAIQGLRSGEKLLDLFSVKTLDGSKQLIQVNIEGVDDKPLLSGNNVAVLDLGTDIETSGSLFINDPDFGESSFQQLSGIRSSLGYGSADIDAQGNWTFNLDTEYTKLNEINEGQTRIDSFEVFTMDGTSQMVNIPIKGNNSPLYAQDDAPRPNPQALALHDLVKEDNQQDDISTALNKGIAINQSNDSSSTLDNSNTELSNSSANIETTLLMNNGNDALQTLNTHLHDINIG